jgi:hypothetical protein
VQQRSPVLTRTCALFRDCRASLKLVHGEIVSSRIQVENLKLDSEQRQQILSFVAKIIPVIVIYEIVMQSRLAQRVMLKRASQQPVISTSSTKYASEPTLRFHLPSLVSFFSSRSELQDFGNFRRPN